MLGSYPGFKRDEDGVTMANKRRNWTHDETLMAFVLYYTLPPKEIDKTGEDINELARAIGRTPNSVALKA